MRLYTPREAIDCWWRNLVILAYAVVGINPGLDPEQGGSSYVWGWKDRAVLWSLAILCASSAGGPNAWGILLWVLSPVVVCFFLELGNEMYRGPRVWLPRWYLSIAGVVMILLNAPDALRWILVMLWALQSFEIAGAFQTERGYYERHKAENPNPDPYRMANLPFQYLREGHQSIAEDEFRRVLEHDPTNPRAKAFLGLLEANRNWIRAGNVGVAFSCMYCQAQHSRMLKDGDTLEPAEYNALFLRICPRCGKRSEFSIMESEN